MKRVRFTWIPPQTHWSQIWTGGQSAWNRVRNIQLNWPVTERYWLVFRACSVLWVLRGRCNRYFLKRRDDLNYRRVDCCRPWLDAWHFDCRGAAYRWINLRPIRREPRGIAFAKSAREEGTPPAVSPRDNAVFDLTGKRLQEMTFSKNVDFLTKNSDTYPSKILDRLLNFNVIRDAGCVELWHGLRPWSSSTAHQKRFYE